MIITNEGPIEDGDRSGEHAFHGAFSHLLSHGGPENGHGLWPANITVDDRRFHTPGPVRLHPSIGGEGKTRQLLTEVFNHVVSL